MLQKLRTLDKWLGAAEDAIMGVGLLAAAIVLFTNIVLRYGFSLGFHWAEEYVRYSIIWIVFIGSGGVARRMKHLSVSALVDAVGPRAARVLNMIRHVIVIVFVAFLAVYGFETTFTMMGRAQYSSALQIPMWTVYLPIGIGGALMTLRYTQHFIADVFGKSQDDSDNSVMEET